MSEVGVEYRVEWACPGWRIERGIVNGIGEYSDYYTGIDAPWGPYTFAYGIEPKVFRFKWQANRALRKFIEYLEAKEQQRRRKNNGTTCNM